MAMTGRAQAIPSTQRELRTTQQRLQKHTTEKQDHETGGANPPGESIAAQGIRVHLERRGCMKSVNGIASARHRGDLTRLPFQWPRIRDRESRVRTLMDWTRWWPRPTAKGTSSVSVHRFQDLCVAHPCSMGRCSDPGSHETWGLTGKPLVGPSCHRCSAHRAAMPIEWDRKAQQSKGERHLGKRPNSRTRAVMGV